MRKFLFFLLCTVTSYLLASCEKEEHLDGKGDKPLVDTPKDTIQEEFLLKWVYFTVIAMTMEKFYRYTVFRNTRMVTFSNSTLHIYWSSIPRKYIYYNV